MSITGAVVMFAMTWFMVFFMVLPIRFVSQGDTGEVVPGTPRSAPAGNVVARKAWITTAIAVVVWCILAAIIVSGKISIRDIDIGGVMGPAPVDGGN
jgi:predicted secreted protein